MADHEKRGKGLAVTARSTAKVAEEATEEVRGRKSAMEAKKQTAIEMAEGVDKEKALAQVAELQEALAELDANLAVVQAEAHDATALLEAFCAEPEPTVPERPPGYTARPPR